MKKYDKNIAQIRNEVLNSQSSRCDVDLNQIFTSLIRQYIKYNDSLLDIGTGNGFVLKVINDAFLNLNLRLYGIDNSKSMLDTAYQSDNIKYKVEDNYSINMPDENFDIITAKNVTRFSSDEIYRLLKYNGVFIFREYGIGKGLIEFTELFSERITRARAPESYVKELEKSGLSIVKLYKFIIKREFSDIESLINTTKSYSLIKNYSETDQKRVRELYKNHEKIIVHSDPFIVIAKKQKEK